MLRGLSINSNVFDYLVDSLVNAFQETMATSQNDEYEYEYEDEDEQEDDDDDIDRYPPNILLWLLFVGGAAAEGRRYRQWFFGSNFAQAKSITTRLMAGDEGGSNSVSVH